MTPLPAWVRLNWLARGLCQQCGQHPYVTVWAGNGLCICQECLSARQRDS